MAKTNALITGKWAVGYDHNNNGTVLRFDFAEPDPPLVLWIQRDDALLIARAILDHYERPPPKPHRLS